MNNVTATFKSTFFLSILCFLVLFPLKISAQVSITQQEFLSVFTPSSQHYYSPMAEGSINIGKTGGANVYDFSFIDFNSLQVSNNYLISSIPDLMSYYPSSAITIGETPSSIEKNPVFYVSNDSVYQLGEASNYPENKIKHYTPYELLGIFPTVYGAEFSQSVTLNEMTFDSNWNLIHADTSSSLETTKIDGYGTLKLANGNYDCIRIKKDHVAYGDKEYIYLTKEGAFIIVGGVERNDPDSGSVAGGYQLLLKPSLVYVKDKNLKPNSFTLEQNYPNPFNPTTKITYSITKTDFVKLSVYNILGKEIASLVSKEEAAGQYEVEFNGNKLSSGIYFYRLQAGNNIQIRKMIFMK